jgi:hypothetical protein
LFTQVDLLLVLPPPSIPASNIHTIICNPTPYLSVLVCILCATQQCFLYTQADLPLVLCPPLLPASNIHTIIRKSHALRCPKPC